MGALAYTFQLYFDFSGYSDMAIGLGLFFGIKLPINFVSPYQSTSIAEFWRRWHITLSRFLRNYIYIPLGGNRKGVGQRYLNLIITMGLGGLWHGAGWTFLVWGFLHGGYLVVNHLWSKSGHRMSTSVAWLLTMLAVIFGWVLFRATTFTGAVSVLSAMIIPTGPLEVVAPIPTPILAWLGISAVAVVTFYLPNSIELAGYVHSAPNFESDPVPVRRVKLRVAPELVAILLGLVAALVMAKLPDPGIFLYFNF
jgi:alginate O-acetyltransferase complex protein AlgI